MKPKYKPKPKGSVIAALDIGSSKISCFIGRVTDNSGGYEVVGVGHKASKGIKQGSITNLSEAETCIRQTVHAAENMAAEVMKGYPLRDVIVNVPGVHASTHSCQADVRILSHEVTDNDIRRALSKAQDDIDLDDHELIHTIPANYQIDGQNEIHEPRGMYGQTLLVDINMVSAKLGPLRNIATCIERSHLDITSFCHSGYAAGLAALVEDEMDLGCTLIDMGGGVTSIAVFQNNSLIFADAIPVGGNHVTHDLAKGLTTALNDAERLKILYGSAMGSATDDSELIDVPKIGEGEHSSPNHIPRSLLIGIIQPRLEEIFELVRARLDDSGLAAQLGRRVVLTGGASQLPAMRDLASHVLDKQVRLGKPIRMSGLPEAVNGPAFATTAGLLTYLSEHSHEMPAVIMTQVEPGTMWERVKFWLKENW